jgi:Mn2+/Fe2+ NRAMP family transporter
MAFEIEQPADLGPSPVIESTKPRLLGVLGPGLITGASDDDPSGIATYSQAGAQFGYALTWTMLFTYPLMTAVQIVSGRMGRTTGRGLAGNLRQHCPTWLLTSVVMLLLTANTINLGADLGAMADASRLVLGGPQVLYVLLFATICISLQVFLQYTRYVSVLKWLTLVLFAYVATLFTMKVPVGRGPPKFRRSLSALGQGLPNDRRRCARHDDQSIPVLLAGFAGSRGCPDPSGPPNSEARAGAG